MAETEELLNGCQFDRVNRYRIIQLLCLKKNPPARRSG
jgi:hypothetical protein